jgi:hypothetical protein
MDTEFGHPEWLDFPREGSGATRCADANMIPWPTCVIAHVHLLSPTAIILLDLLCFWFASAPVLDTAYMRETQVPSPM